MTNKNVQLQDMAGNNLFPKTVGSVVYNNSNEALGGVEAGAQVNVIETVKVNGTALTVSNKAVDVTIAAAPVYTIAEASTATSGFLKTYELKKELLRLAKSLDLN